jgi:tetratricopeptide (TPR) repeat protein
MKQTVAPDIVSSMAEKGALGRQAWQRGAIAEAEKYFLEIWELLPDPKTEYDRAQSLSRGLVTFYRDTKQFEKANRWLGVMQEAYGPGPDESVEFLAATVHFEAGDLDRAFRIFDAQFKQYKQRPFQGEDKKYLEFYKRRTGGGEMTSPPDIPARLDALVEEGNGLSDAGEMTLSPAISARLDRLAEEGNELSDAGDHAAAVEKWSEALDLIPEPKTDWEASTWLYASIGDGYYVQGKFEDASAALFDALNCPDASENPFIAYRLGQSQTRLGNVDKGVEYLLRAYMLDGEDIFSSDQNGEEFLAILRSRNLV